MNMKKFLLKIKIKSSGFSIIETLVSIFLFSVIALVVSGVLVRSMQVERRVFANQVIQENALAVLGIMAKEVRVGSVANQDTNCSTQAPITSLTINHPIEGIIVYRLNSGGMVERVIGSATYIVSSSDVIFNSLGFCVIGSTLPEDNESDRVTIVASISNKIGPDFFTVSTQTTVVSRNVSNEF